MNTMRDLPAARKGTFPGISSRLPTWRPSRSGNRCLERRQPYLVACAPLLMTRCSTFPGGLRIRPSVVLVADDISGNFNLCHVWSRLVILSSVANSAHAQTRCKKVQKGAIKCRKVQSNFFPWTSTLKPIQLELRIALVQTTANPSWASALATCHFLDVPQ